MEHDPIDQPHKSRFGRVSSKRKFSDEYLTYENGTVKVGQLGKKNKLVSNPTNNSSLKSYSSTYLIDYEIGDVVWAKMGKFPVWPGIIIHDPDSKIYFKGDGDSLMFHLYFCNDMQKRSWIKKSQIFEFGGRKKILTKYPKLNNQISRSKLKLKWNNAIDEAEYFATMKKEERITAFFKNNLRLTEKLKCDKVNPKPKSSSTKVVLSTRHMIKTSPKIKVKLEHKVSYEKEHPRVLIPELCKQFYSNGWVTGTGGGISIKYKDQIFIAPSGVQKERMEPEDLFVQDVNGVDVQCPPPEKLFTKSQCTPIFMCSYIERQAGAVIHTHSPDVVKLSLLNPDNEVRISGLEMIKGIYNEELGRFYNNDEDVIIPIIENSKFERDLVETFQQALKKYPATSAVLVRNHGMYVWGKDWKTAKTQCECYDYCFNILVFKKTNNI